MSESDPCACRTTEHMSIHIPLPGNDGKAGGCRPVIFPLFPASLGIWYLSANPIFQKRFLEQGENRR